MKMDKRKVVLIVAAVVVLAALASYAIWRGSGPRPPQAPAPTYADKGQLIPGFPKELVLKPDARIESSYSIRYSSTTNQYAAQWRSSSSLESIAAQYKNYLEAKGWAVTINPVTQPWLRAISAVTSTWGSQTRVLVGISAQGKEAQITVSYVTK